MGTKLVLPNVPPDVCNCVPVLTPLLSPPAVGAGGGGSALKSTPERVGIFATLLLTQGLQCVILCVLQIQTMNAETGTFTFYADKLAPTAVCNADNTD